MQYVITEASAAIGGKFSLSYGGEQTTDIDFDASAAVVEAALENLSTLITHGVTVVLHAGPGSNGERTWHITFPTAVGRVHDSIQPIITNGYLLTGNAVKMKAGVFTTGVTEKHIHGSPFTVLVAPEMTDPARTIAYGEGLVHGEAGRISDQVLVVWTRSVNKGIPRIIDNTRVFLRVWPHLPTFVPRGVLREVDDLRPVY